MRTKPLIYLVDDDPMLEMILNKYLENKFGNFRMEGFETGQKVLESLQRETPDAMFLDYQMPGMNGLDVLHEMKARYPEVPVYMLSSTNDEELQKKFLDEGARKFISKQYDGFAETLDTLFETL